MYIPFLQRSMAINSQASFWKEVWKDSPKGLKNIKWELKVQAPDNYSSRTASFPKKIY